MKRDPQWGDDSVEGANSHVLHLDAGTHAEAALPPLIDVLDEGVPVKHDDLEGAVRKPVRGDLGPVEDGPVVLERHHGGLHDGEVVRRGAAGVLELDEELVGPDRLDSKPARTPPDRVADGIERVAEGTELVDVDAVLNERVESVRFGGDSLVAEFEVEFAPETGDRFASVEWVVEAQRPGDPTVGGELVDDNKLVGDASTEQQNRFTNPVVDEFTSDPAVFFGEPQ